MKPFEIEIHTSTPAMNPLKELKWNLTQHVSLSYLKEHNHCELRTYKEECAVLQISAMTLV
jgi:hypothetical protein